MFVTELGIVIEVKLHLLNALLPIIVTELGMVTDVKLVQDSKVLLLILVIELGIVISFKPLQY